MTIMISLVGEQPIPNLLPVRHLQPDKLLLLTTFRTRQTAERLRQLIQADVYTPQVDAYALLETRDVLDAKLKEIWEGEEPLIFNFTGGTKNMALAAYMVATRYAAPLLYFQTEGHQSLLHEYRFNNEELVFWKKTSLPTLITNHDYIFAHVGEYQTLGLGRETSDILGKQFERQVHDALLPHVDEITPGVKPIGDLDIDLIVRCGNQVGLVEVKSGNNTRKGINQLKTAGSREYFGTYTERFLVSNIDWSQRRNQQQLTDEVGDAIHVVEVQAFSQTNPVVSDESAQKIASIICRELGQQ